MFLTGVVLRKQSFVILVFSVIVLGVFLLIYKQATVTRLLYQQQKLEKEYAECTGQHIRLTQQLFKIKNPASIQNYACKILGMQKTVLASVHRMPKIASFGDR